MILQTRQNESALVRAAREGDKDAMLLLLRQNWVWLKGLVCGVITNSHDVDDVLQDICVQVISKIDKLNEPELFVRWLSKIARRQALQFKRKKRQRVIPFNDEIITQQHDDKGGEQFEIIEKKERYELILEAINSLPEKYRQVLILQYTGELSYAQIAEILDIPITTVQIRLVRARRMVGDKLNIKNKHKVKKG
jgi:RNA polymerase sigma-70 factor (ECF subfamily)